MVSEGLTAAWPIIVFSCKNWHDHIVGTMIMYNLESGVENSKMKTVLDALWWCIATVTTVGYVDVVPVTNLGRIVAIS
jgi:hypothetical protein